MIANFSTLINLQSTDFRQFRSVFSAKLESLFIVPADSFENVKGQFPIGFFVWKTGSQSSNLGNRVKTDVYEKTDKIGIKTIFIDNMSKTITDWIKNTVINEDKSIGFLARYGADFQHSNYTYIKNSKEQLSSPKGNCISISNLREVAVYLAVRKSIKRNWLNDRDQFYYPKNSWESDTEFQTDCLAWTLFNNDISANYGINHWIPFTEIEVNAKDAFASHLMTDYMSGKLGGKASAEPSYSLLPVCHNVPDKPLVFSNAALEVFNAGRELWRYYHQQEEANTNAAFYDIKAHFQGFSAKGSMNKNSTDTQYNMLIRVLREKLAVFEEKIAPKIYEHGFLIK